MELHGQAKEHDLQDSIASVFLDLKQQRYLEDHCVAQTCVAPGAALVAEALVTSDALVDIEFHCMIPLTKSGVTELEINRSGENVVFKDPNSSTVYASAHRNSRGVQFKMEAVAAGTTLSKSIDGKALYTRLDRQGNNYGPEFRCIQHVEYDSERGVASWKINTADSADHALIILIDNLTHVLAAIAEISNLYYLRAIDSIELFSSVEITTDATIECVLETSAANSHSASFTVRNSTGATVLIVSGLTIAISEPDTNVESIALAGTFTLDPMAEVFEMWNKRLAATMQPRLADYGQVFQTLYQANNTFDNSSDARVCFVRLEDWAANERDVKKLSSVEVAKQFSGFKQYELPDGRTIAQLNQYETAYLFREIFIDYTYKRHGVIIQDNDVVIDIGANIGLCTLFVSDQAENVKVFSIEPSPAVLPILKANVAAYAPNTTVVAAGASKAIGEAVFTAYKNSSVFSSFAADTSDDHEAISRIIRNTLVASGNMDESLVHQAVEEMMSDRMESEDYLCPLVSVSDVIEQNAINKIGLLKIDAEKSEDAIIAGIKEEHWEQIEQVIIEVHKQSGNEVTEIIKLLNKKGFECIEDEETLLTDSGLVTVYAVRPERAASNQAHLPQTAVAQSSQLFIDAVDSFQQETSRSLDIVLCPSTTRDPVLNKVIQDSEKSIVEHFADHDAVDAQLWTDYCSLYPVKEIADDVSNQLGHIPYTKSWFAATTTTLIRKHLSSKRMPYKVIVLDCDNTLWDGVVGESGAEGVRFDEGHLALQLFVKQQSDAGKLICLASKNDEAGVQEVFETRASEMQFSWDDIVAHRINWDRKSDNLVSLANELNLGLDSFIFIDDSPIECAEVRGTVPQVLSLQLPSRSSDFATFLDHVWSFDNSAVTSEDKVRSQRYQEEKKRKEFMTTTNSISDFIAKLQLEYSILPVEEQQLHRSSQMSMRTNQFNLSTIRRSEAEIQHLVKEGWHCEYITVADRFGDYGITGLAIYHAEDSVLEVDTLLLSCRVLGRGIEHAFVRHIGNKAVEFGCSTVSFNYAKTAKNEPAIKFLLSVGKKPSALESRSGALALNVNELTTLEYNPVARSESSEKSKSVMEPLAAAPFELTEMIATELNNANEIARVAADRVRMPRPELEQVFIRPRTELEFSIAEIWCELLGYSEVGVEDDFFKLGGSSLKSVEMISRVKSTLNANLTVVSIFEKPTVAHLAGIIDSGGVASVASTEGRARGAARRQARLKRKVRTRN